MTALMFDVSHHSAPGAYRRASQSGTARATSQKKPETAPTMAKPTK